MALFKVDIGKLYSRNFSDLIFISLGRICESAFWRVPSGEVVNLCYDSDEGDTRAVLVSLALCCLFERVSS